MARPDRAKQAFSTGMAFHEAAIRCGSPGDDDGGIAATLSSPQAVCMAFAAELYLKAITLRRLDRQEGHNLQWLFEKGLIEAEQDVVRAEFGKQEYAPVEHLPDILRHIARAFENWRYVYEQPTQAIDQTALAAFARAAYHAARLLEPEWSVPDHLHARVSLNSKDKEHFTVSIGDEGQLPPFMVKMMAEAGIQTFNLAALQAGFWGRPVQRSHIRPKDGAS